MNDELITLSEIAAGGVSALNRLRLLIDRTQRAATPMNDAWVSLTAEIERALVDQSRDQDTLMRDVQTALSLLAKRTEECETLRAQLSEAQAMLAPGDRYCCMCGHAICEHCQQDAAPAAPAAPAAQAAQAVADDVVRDAERWRWGCKNARWIRHEHEAYVAIPVARNANLSCYALRVGEVDLAMKVDALLATQQQKAGGAE